MAGFLLNTYNPIDVAFERGDGIYVYDTNGKKYIDALCGIAVTGLGHNHPAITEAICEQAGKILHTSNFVKIPYQMELAESIVKTCGFDAKVFFGNSGTEADEALIKFARLYGHSKNIDEPKIIVMENAFHGRTMACLSASGSRKVQAGFEPLVQGFVRAKYNDINALKAIAESTKDVVAVLLEPVQGEAGINVPDNDYLKKIRKICDDNNWLMLVDEIQTGIGRTGKMFAFEHAGIEPDGMALAKGLGNGVPIGATVINGKHADLFKPGSHGTTFGGNPMSCRVALAVINEIKKNNLSENAAKQGAIIKSILEDKLKGNSHVVDIRGLGLMIGVELDKPCRDILKIALDKGIIFNITKENTLRLLPPLIINDNEAKLIADTMVEVIEEYYK